MLLTHLNKAFTDCKKDLFFVGLFSLAINFLVLTLPIYSLQLFDRVLSSASLDTLFALLVIAVLLLSAQAVIEHVRTQLLQKSGLKLDVSLSPSLIADSIRQSSQQNRIQKRGLQDLAELRNFLVTPSTSAIFDIPWVPVFLLILFILHPYIGAVALVGSVVFAVLSILMMYAARKPSGYSQDLAAKTSMELNDYLRNAPTLRAMGMADNVGNIWNKRNSEQLDLQWQLNSRTGQLLAISRYFRTLLQVVILTVGVMLALDQQIGTGAIIASSILMARVLAPFEQAVSGWKGWYSAYQAYHRLKNMECSKAQQAKTALPEPRGELLLKQVGLKFDIQKEPVLQNISFKLGAGNALAIMGNSGSGKSTLAALIMGIHKPSMGSIKIDGASLELWPEEQFGRHIGYLPQEVGLLAGTVAENICRFSEASAEDIIHAARLACIHELIISLPKGYDTYLGEGGMQLSGGQKQRIGLARAIFSNPSVLVLDEPNSNLDPEGEVALAIVLQYCKENRITVVMISHRPGFLRQMDWVIVLKDGKIEKAGTCDKFLGAMSEVDGSQRVEQNGPSEPLVSTKKASPVAQTGGAHG
ncbi:type I secretion system permease/ATPase [Photobacterium sanguinicancri]|uniref:type I secretion system permease/ATPase n=1 Tax=Photobacterium sanguinicancri TaxID=875932 RepID=UPI0026E2CD60|nr:type I secretion system permease/ATPase [Photobacterium sanguinicancri]MDO6498606.1 type I secretion system permease/ATPase [Photobacterium sanguinicancri]